MADSVHVIEYEAVNPRAEEPFRIWISRNAGYAVFAVCLVTFLIYRTLIEHSFLAYDDGFFVTENGYVKRGLTWSSFVWSWTTTLGFYHPITWLSLMLDSTLFGVNPATFHLTNLWLHLVNTALLYCFLKRATGEAGKSLIVACLFAWHPVNVESVAWIAERKGLLATCFALVALIAYVRYVERPTRGRFLLVGAAMLLSLLCKSMTVILPALFLVLDYWPLKRFRMPDSEDADRQTHQAWRRGIRLIVEKTPLFALALIFIILTVKAEANVGAFRSIDEFSVGDRALNVVSTVPLYLKQLLLPSGYAAHYPMPVLSQQQLLLLIAGFVLLIWVFIRNIRTREPTSAGIMWFLICLAPVLGILKIGTHFMADRYTYLAQVGVFVALVWTISARAWITPRIQATAFAVVSVVLILATRHHLPNWKNDLALALNGERVTGKNSVVCYGLGIGYELAGDRERSLRHFQEVMEHYVDYAGVHYNIARACVLENQPKRALVHLERALRLSPADPIYHNLIAQVLSSSPDPAVRNSKKALEHASFACKQVQNRNPLFLDTLAAAYAEAGEFSDAVIAGTGAMHLTPSADVRKLISERIQLYSQGKPFRGVLFRDTAPRKQEVRKNN